MISPRLAVDPCGFSKMLILIFTAGISCGGLAQEAPDWAGAQVTKTDLLAGETRHGKSAYFFAASMTRSGCHVAKVEGERGVEMFVRLDGKRGKSYENIAPPVFSADGRRLGYAVRGTGDSRFVINEQEGPPFDEVLPDTFVFSGNGNRHAYLARKQGQLVAVVDGVVQAQTGDGLVPRLQPPVFSADGSSVGYVEVSRLKGKMRVVVNGKPGQVFDGGGADTLRFSPDGKRFSYSAYDPSAGGRWFCILDGQQQNAFDGLGVSYAFSADGKRFAYTARKGRQWFLMEAGQPGIPIEGIVDHSLIFSPDSHRLAFAVGTADRRAHLVVDGKSGPVLDNIGASYPATTTGLAPNRASMQTFYGLMRPWILFSPDSSRVAYVARVGQAKRVFVNDKDDGVEIDYLVGGIVFSEDSKRLAYGGRGYDKLFREKQFLVVDGKKGAEYDELGYFDFSQDGKHVAYAANTGTKFVIVVDGVEHGVYSAVPAGPVFRSDGVLEVLVSDGHSLYRIEVKNL